MQFENKHARILSVKNLAENVLPCYIRGDKRSSKRGLAKNYSGGCIPKFFLFWFRVNKQMYNNINFGLTIIHVLRWVKPKWIFSIPDANFTSVKYYTNKTTNNQCIDQHLFDVFVCAFLFFFRFHRSEELVVSWHLRTASTSASFPGKMWQSIKYQTLISADGIRPHVKYKAIRI